MRIQPDAGTVKTGEYRDVPLHPQLIELGFWDVVLAADGPLFYQNHSEKDPLQAARVVGGKVGQWMQTLGLVPEGVSPNHGWRHRFKTVGREVGIEDRILDALQGHSAKTAGDRYGDVTVKSMQAAMEKVPRYDLGPKHSPINA